MKRLIILLLLLLQFTGFAKIYLRYNLVGYEPDRSKQVIVMATTDESSTNWTITDSAKTVVLKGVLGNSETGKGAHMPMAFNYSINFSKLKTVGKYQLTVGKETAQLTIAEQPYAFLPHEIIRYYRVLRSGSSDAEDHKFSHYGDKSCTLYRKETSSNTSWKEGKDQKKVDILGGWYDAGDYLKFTLTTAYSAYALLLSYEINPELFKGVKNYSKTDLIDILDEAKWGLDYLLKVMPDDKEFIIQVGSADDHKQGDRMPNHDELDGKRPAYSAFSPTQMGYTAAALALGSKVFSSIGKQEDAEAYKTMAIKIYERAIYEESAAWIEEGWEKFYFDQSIHDNMELAATELYKLTGEKRYLSKAKTYAEKAGAAYWYSWGSFNMIAHLRLSEESGSAIEPLTTDLDFFKGISEEENNLWGLPHKYTWSSLYSFFGVGNAAMLYQLNKKGTYYNKLAYNVLDYSLGMNNWGMAMVASQKIPNSVENIYSQIYRLKPKLYPSGAIAEGPGDKATHDRLKQYFHIPEINRFDEFNTDQVVFYDYEHDFQTMETTICGLSDGLLFFTLMSKLHSK